MVDVGEGRGTDGLWGHRRLTINIKTNGENNNKKRLQVGNVPPPPTPQSSVPTPMFVCVVYIRVRVVFIVVLFVIHHINGRQLPLISDAPWGRIGIFREGGGGNAYYMWGETLGTRLI